MMVKGRTFYRYSLAFKQKVVSEIEKGKLGISEAKRLYGIKGEETIQLWIKKLGKNHLLNKVVRIEMKDEKDLMRELQKENKKLKEVLGDARVKEIALETLVEVINEEYGIDAKKNFGSKVSKGML